MSAENAQDVAENLTVDWAWALGKQRSGVWGYPRAKRACVRPAARTAAFAGRPHHSTTCCCSRP